MKLGRVIVAIAMVALAAFLGVTQVGRWDVQRLTAEVNRLEHERTQLIEYAERLCASRRVAQVNVVRQYDDERGRCVTVLRWQEIGQSGQLGEPQTVEVLGRQVYFEALLLKFTHEHVGKGDPNRSASVAMFRRVFGDQQPPETGVNLGATPSSASGNESYSLRPELWDRFYELVEDPSLASRYGIRAAQCEAPAVPMRTGQVWEITLDAIGGLNLKRLDEADLFNVSAHESTWAGATRKESGTSRSE